MTDEIIFHGWKYRNFRLYFLLQKFVLSNNGSLNSCRERQQTTHYMADFQWINFHSNIWTLTLYLVHKWSLQVAVEWSPNQHYFWSKYRLYTLQDCFGFFSFIIFLLILEGEREIIFYYNICSFNTKIYYSNKNIFIFIFS